VTSALGSLGRSATPDYPRTGKEGKRTPRARSRCSSRTARRCHSYEHQRRDGPWLSRPRPSEGGHRRGPSARHDVRSDAAARTGRCPQRKQHSLSIASPNTATSSRRATRALQESPELQKSRRTPHRARPTMRLQSVVSDQSDESFERLLLSYSDRRLNDKTGRKQAVEWPSFLRTP
jgi:hypothetical protein